MRGSKGNTALVLQARDHKLFSELASMRIADRELAKLVAGFSSTTRANTRLLQLTRAGLLNRFFVGTVAFGRKAIYTLSTKGAALIAAPYRAISRRFGRTLVGDLFVEHQIHINEIYVKTKFQALPTGIQFLDWRSFHQPPVRNSGLIPDGYLELETSAGRRAMFLEADMGTETRPVWEKKIRAYLQLAISGEFTRVFHQPQFRVLVITTSRKRLDNIRAVAAKQTDKLFWFTTFECINRDGLWSPIWLRPGQDQRHSLL